jgi:hypothetical protein
MSEDKTERIRKLNDQLRCHQTGGQVVMTSGVQPLGQANISCLLNAIATFDAFTADNDPWSEHDCATIKHDGETFIWKIDYYDQTLTYGSSDPADPTVTSRVLTIMLASEY